MILTHELAHIRRSDMWVNLLQHVAEAVLFFNPFVWILSWQIRDLREFCCDEIACDELSRSVPDPRVRYADAILRMVEQANPAVLREAMALSSAGSSASELRRRITRLLGEPVRNPVRLPKSGAAALVVFVVIFLGFPFWGGSADAQEEDVQLPFTRLSLQTTAMWRQGNHTLNLQGSGAYELHRDWKSARSSSYRLSNLAKVRLSELLEVATIAQSDENQLLRAADATRHKLTLERAGSVLTLERDSDGLDDAHRSLVGFLDQIIEQEELYYGITDERASWPDKLTWINLQLDTALRRRNPLSPPTLAFEYQRLVPRLTELAQNPDQRIASRAQRALRTIAQLPTDFSGQRVARVEPHAKDRLASFGSFHFTESDGKRPQHSLIVEPDGWLTFLKLDGSAGRVIQRQVARISARVLEQLDSLVKETNYFMDERASLTSESDAPSYTLGVVADSRFHQVECRGAQESAAYARLIRLMLPVVEAQRAAATDGVQWSGFSPERYKRNVAEGTPMLVHLMAGWRSDAYLNHEQLFHSPQLSNRLKEAGFVCLRADVSGGGPDAPLSNEFREFRTRVFRGPGLALCTKNQVIELDGMPTTKLLSVLRDAALH